MAHECHPFSSLRFVWFRMMAVMLMTHTNIHGFRLDNIFSINSRYIKIGKAKATGH